MPQFSLTDLFVTVVVAIIIALVTLGFIFWKRSKERPVLLPGYVSPAIEDLGDDE